ncbi:MAG: hypothetical protein WCP97_09570 [bacterium]
MPRTLNRNITQRCENPNNLSKSTLDQFRTPRQNTLARKLNRSFPQLAFAFAPIIKSTDALHQLQPQLQNSLDQTLSSWILPGSGVAIALLISTYIGSKIIESRRKQREPLLEESNSIQKANTKRIVLENLRNEAKKHKHPKDEYTRKMRQIEKFTEMFDRLRIPFEALNFTIDLIHRREIEGREAMLLLLLTDSYMREQASTEENIENFLKQKLLTIARTDYRNQRVTTLTLIEDLARYENVDSLLPIE